MCKLMEDLIDSEMKKIALKMLQDGKLHGEEIAKYFNFILETMGDLADSQVMES